jgi:hypothetical protein
LTTGPSDAGAPSAYGTTIVVEGVGLNCPRIQTDTRPDASVHGSRPALLTVFSDSNATMRTLAPALMASAFCATSGSSTLTMRSTST